MANKKISDLTNAASVALTDLLEMEVGGLSRKVLLSVVRAALVPINLAADITGILPKANQAAQDMAGDVGGTTAASTIANLAVTKLAAGSTGNYLQVVGGVNTWANPSIALGTQVTGTLPVANGGTGITALGTNIAAFLAVNIAAAWNTFAATPSGANLASLLSSALPASKGGTGLTALGTNVATLLGSVLAAGYTTFAVTPSGANLASLLTSALPVSKGGTGATASTGSGNVVLATSPTVATATNTGALTTGGIVQTGTTLNASVGGTVNNCTLGGNLRIRFTNASGPTITGFDATGVADGTELTVYAAAGVIAITHEDVASSAANRCTLQGGTTINLAIGCTTKFTYLTDGTNSRWRHTAGTAI